MKLSKIVFPLLVNLHSLINAMDPSPLQPISIICSDNQQVLIHRKALNQSPTLKSLLEDCGLASESSINISLLETSGANFQTMTIITACMTKLAQHNPEFSRKKSLELIRETIYELMEIIEAGTDIASIGQVQRQELTLNLFSVANYLQLPVIYQAIACIIVRYNIFPLQQLPRFLPQWRWLNDITCPEHDPRICNDMWQKIQEAQHFLSKDFKDIKPDSTEVTLTTYADLCEWGLTSDTAVPKNIKTCNDYINHLIQDHKFWELKIMFDSLAEQHHESFAHNASQLSCDGITQLVTDYINTENFIRLQDMLELLVSNHLIDLAKHAYKKLVDSIKKMSPETATRLFNHPNLPECALKMTLSFQLEQVEYFTKCTQDRNRIDANPNTCLVEFLENFPSPLYEYFNVCNNDTHCPVFAQENLKYLLPIVEPFFGRKAHRLALNGQKISYLPAEICLLTELNTLHIAFNQLVDLPEEIFFIKNLRWLFCGANQFTSVPNVIFHLKNLKVLDLARNQIISLTDELMCMKSLKFLYIDGTAATPALFNQENLKIYLWDNGLNRWIV